MQYLLVEGGAQAAAAFLTAGLVDRLLIYRAPILIGGGKPGLADIGLRTLQRKLKEYRGESGGEEGEDDAEDDGSEA